MKGSQHRTPISTLIIELALCPTGQRDIHPAASVTANPGCIGTCWVLSMAPS
jgi:N-acetyl-gamma-glutamylphosphate reductase